MRIICRYERTRKPWPAFTPTPAARITPLAAAWRCLGAALLAGGLGGSAHAVQNVTLAWNRSPDSSVVGYCRYFGAASGVYTNLAALGDVTNATVAGLVEGRTYYFAVTACTAAGMESLPSAEVVYTVPNPPPTIALTAPASGAAYTAPAAVNLAATVVANGNSIGKVCFYSGATLLGEDAAAPYNWTWNNVGPGSYTLSALALYGGGAVASSPVSVSVAGLPAPWQTVGIGLPSVGSATALDGVYTVSGAGKLGGTSDSFRFVFQPLSGDGEIKARLESLQDTGNGGRMGVMIRESLTGGSKHAFMGISPDGTWRWQRRVRTAAGSSSSTSGTGSPPEAWARLVRAGNTIYAYKSADGTNWTQVNSRSIPMATNIYVGMAVASGQTNVLNQALFGRLTVIP